jgi:hypothetical protein
MTDFPSSPVTETLDQFLDAALRHADGLHAQLTKPEWRPSRAHVEQARNTIRKIVEKVRDNSQLSDMARLSASEAACYRWPEDTAEHRAMRAAYMDGAASTAGHAQTPAEPHETTYLRGWNEGIERAAEVADAARESAKEHHGIEASIGADIAARRIRALADTSTNRTSK